MVTAFAVLSFAWRMLGTGVFLGTISFVAVPATPVFVLRGPWKRAYLAAYLAVYGPFVVVATYAYLFVACSHCKAATWTMLPVGPGVITANIVRRLLDLSPVWGTPGWGINLLLAAVMVATLTWLVWVLGRGWGMLCLAGAVAYCSFSAFVLLALIRA